MIDNANATLEVLWDKEMCYLFFTCNTSIYNFNYYFEKSLFSTLTLALGFRLENETINFPNYQYIFILKSNQKYGIFEMYGKFLGKRIALLY